MVALDQPRLAGQILELAQAARQPGAVDVLGLQALDELQPPNEAQTLGLDIRRARATLVLSVETSDPDLVELGGLFEKPLGRHRFTTRWLHVPLLRIHTA